MQGNSICPLIIYCPHIAEFVYQRVLHPIVAHNGVVLCVAVCGCVCVCMWLNVCRGRRVLARICETMSKHITNLATIFAFHQNNEFFESVELASLSDDIYEVC